MVEIVFKRIFTLKEKNPPLKITDLLWFTWRVKDPWTQDQYVLAHSTSSMTKEVSSTSTYMTAKLPVAPTVKT